jgi:PadR family transcriptional regulator, regulatory protein PadR
MGRWETQLRKGLAELAILAVIGRGETYGYRIVEELERLEGFELTESTVYPILARLTRDGLLAVRTEPSPSGPVRRYYRLATGGQQRLRQLAESWKKVSRSLSSLIEGAQT